jgi:hypothetical protein
MELAAPRTVAHGAIQRPPLLEDYVDRDAVTMEDQFMILGIIVGALALYVMYSPLGI